MPHDRNGRLIEVGDTIHIPCKVTSIHMTEDYCNLTVCTIDLMPPYNAVQSITLNTKQVVRVNIKDGEIEK